MAKRVGRNQTGNNGIIAKTFIWEGKKLTIKQLCAIDDVSRSTMVDRLNASNGVVTKDIISNKPMPRVKRLNPAEIANLALKALIPQGLSSNGRVM